MKRVGLEGVHRASWSYDGSGALDPLTVNEPLAIHARSILAMAHIIHCRVLSFVKFVSHTQILFVLLIRSFC
jgi:hypothetical protein